MMAKDVERFRRIEALFEGALDYPTRAEREAYLTREGDAELVAEVRQLLADDAQLSAAVPPPAEALPAFGAWQAIRLLGRGGMGVVYLAERSDGAFEMRAAVKVVPLALASVSIEERFRRERQFLASLENPKLARLIDGGLTSAGLPYLVMEYVNGLPIDRYCETRGLDLRERIGLIRQLIEALLYVHGQQVIHRDLKASNILVDAAGKVKLLDFGTARLVDASGDHAITKTGVFAFTPECASPEQVQGRPVTFASDIYSAGVLMYRLLTRRSPYRLPEEADVVADTISRAEPEASGLDGPLDAILQKALRKNPEERYPSAEQMDADLARYLEGRPVEARNPRKLGRIAAAMAIACIGAAVAWFALHGRVPPAPPSIAVFPFTGGGYLSRGLTGEIAQNLARNSTLSVAAQAAAEQAGKIPDLRKAGRLLNVTHLLTGDVQKTGDQLKIVANLIRTSDGARIWTNTYQRPIGGLNSIETELENAIAISLGIAKFPPARRHVPNQRAYDFFLKARYEWNQPTPQGNALSQQYYRRALELDPDYADAWAGLGGAIWNRDLAEKSPTDVKLAADCYQRALRLDPGNLWAHGQVAGHAMYFDWDWKRAEREFQLIAAGNSAFGEIGLAFLYQLLGRPAEAEKHARRMQELDPVSYAGKYNIAQYLYLAGRYAESREEWRTITEQFPANPEYQMGLAKCDARTGKPQDAILRLRRIAQPSPFITATLASAEALAGHREEALRIARSMELANHDGRIPNYAFALMYADIGDQTATVKYLDRAMDRHEPAVIYLPVIPCFAKWQNTPEFHRLKKRLGLDW